MHQKKIPRVKNILHSIPILCSSGYTTNSNNRSIVIKNKHLRYVSSSIPLCSIVALLLLSICIISPDGFGIGSSSSVYAEEGISTQAEIQSPTASASLSIEGDLTQTTSAGMGNGPAFRSHNVSISTTDITEYSLRISYANGSDSLQYYSTNGSSISTNGTTMTGAGGVVASNMDDNTWGYAWNTNIEVSPESQTYYTMPTYGSSGSGIANGELLPMSSTNPKQGKVMFAAKFGDRAIAGHYKTAVLLSLIATPQTITVTDYNISFDCKGGSNCPDNVSITESREPTYTYTISTTEPTRTNYTFLGYTTDSAATAADTNYAPGKTITISSSSPSLTLYAVWKANTWDGSTVNNWNDLEYMQQMTPAACASAPKLTPKTVIDSRDNNTYTITKLEDNKCWTTNLRITGDSLVANGHSATITSKDSNVSSDYTISGVSYGGNEEYGVNYPWCVATAGSCTSNGTASASICSKGWRLPNKEEYGVIAGKVSGGFDHGWTLAGGFFPAAHANGFNGYYCSSNAYDKENVYHLYFFTNQVGMANNLRWNFGYSVRCIAQ